MECTAYISRDSYGWYWVIKEQTEDVYCKYSSKYIFASKEGAKVSMINFAFCRKLILDYSG